MVRKLFECIMLIGVFRHSFTSEFFINLIFSNSYNGEKSLLPLCSMLKTYDQLILMAMVGAPNLILARWTTHFCVRNEYSLPSLVQI